MRILIATLHRNIVGGVEKYLQALIPELVQRGHQLGIAHAFRGDPEVETIDDPELCLPAWSLEEYGGEGVWYAAEKWRPDVIYSNGFEEADSEDIFRDHSTLRFSHDYKGTCVSGRKCHRWPYLTPCGSAFGPKCLAVYYPQRCGGLNPLTLLRRYRQQSALHGRLARYQAVAVATRHMHQEMLKNGVPSEKLHLLRLPVVDGVRSSEVPAREGPRGNILFIGRLTDLKGVQYLLRAVPVAERMLARPLALRIAGDGAEIQRLRQEAHALGVNARFCGWISAGEKAELMRESDLMAVPSVWPEPFGLVGIEAGFAGLPSVGYDVGGIPDWLIPGESGELAPGNPPTVKGLAEAICRALSDPSHYYRLCRGAWQAAREFSMEAHVERLESILAIVAGQQEQGSRGYAPAQQSR